MLQAFHSPFLHGLWSEGNNLVDGTKSSHNYNITKRRGHVSNRIRKSSQEYLQRENPQNKNTINVLYQQAC